MSVQTQNTDTLPVDTVDADLARARAMIQAAVADTLDPQFDVPASFAERGYERLPYGGGLFGIRRDHYIYRPMRAWDVAQKFVDELIERTGGGVFVLVHEVLATLSAVGSDAPAEGEDPAEHARVMGEVFTRRVNKHWQDFLDSNPRLQPYALARRVIEACDVRRLPHPDEADKPEPERDPGGSIFAATGPGAVERFYRGRRHQVLRLGVAAAWGSVGDFFVPG